MATRKYLDNTGLSKYDENIKDYIDNIIETDVAPAIDAKVNSSDLADVATSGDYDDLENKPFESVGEGMFLQDSILGLDFYRTSVTITPSEWSSFTCTRYIFEVNPNSTVIVSPDPVSFHDCAEANLICSGQGSGSLTFSCNSTLTNPVTLNILILNVQSANKGPISMSISGSFESMQFTGMAPDPKGLTFTVTFSDGDVLEVEPTSTTPAVWGDTEGTQTMTFNYAVGTDTVSASITGNVISASSISEVLNENSWSIINTVAASGKADEYWNIGDWKNITVSAGTVGGISIPAGTYRATIIGINHNPTKENPHSIDFAIGRDSNGVDIAFRGNDASGTQGVAMTSSAGTSGGWVGSQMYLTYLPAFYNLLAGNEGLQDAMIAPKKYTHNTIGGSANNDENKVTLSEDSSYKMFLMSEFEIQGVRTHANQYEQNYQAQYDYFKSSVYNHSKVRYKHTDSTVATDYWTRSPRCSALLTTYYCMTGDDGSAGWDSSNDAHGLLPCFRVGGGRHK